MNSLRRRLLMQCMQHEKTVVIDASNISEIGLNYFDNIFYTNGEIRPSGTIMVMKLSNNYKDCKLRVYFHNYGANGPRIGLYSTAGTQSGKMWVAATGGVISTRSGNMGTVVQGSQFFMEIEIHDSSVMYRDNLGNEVSGIVLDNNAYSINGIQVNNTIVIDKIEITTY